MYKGKRKAPSRVAVRALSLARQLNRTIETKVHNKTDTGTWNNPVYTWGYLATAMAPEYHPTYDIATGVNTSPDTPGRIGNKITAVGLKLDLTIYASSTAAPTYSDCKFGIYVLKSQSNDTFGTQNPSDDWTIIPDGGSLDSQPALYNLYRDANTNTGMPRRACPFKMLYKKEFILSARDVTDPGLFDRKRVVAWIPMNHTVHYSGDLGTDVTYGDILVYIRRLSPTNATDTVSWKWSGMRRFYYKDA